MEWDGEFRNRIRDRCSVRFRENSVAVVGVVGVYSVEVFRVVWG